LAFEQQLIGALAKFEHQYLSRSLTHLFEPINHIFAPGRAAPVPDDVVRITFLPFLPFIIVFII
jgi:hypothetical protein